MIQALKINQGTKFGTLKTPMFSLFDVIILIILIQNIYGTNSSFSNIFEKTASLSPSLE